MTADLRRTIAAIRFGYGLGSGPAPEPEEMLAGLWRPDGMEQRHPVPRFDDIIAQLRLMAPARQAIKRGDPGAQAALDALDQRLAAMREQSLNAIVLRAVDTPQPLRERLIHFWSDHFTVRAGNGPIGATLGSYMYETIGQNLTGRFGDMLRAVAKHPLMLWYLDQASSVGPNSVVGRKRGLGLNENYARELLELHTLGVGGDYAQGDVSELAALLAGMRFSYERGFFFAQRRSEPGAETVIGRRFGAPGPGRLADVHAVLDALAVHPDTARHMARKLAVHFIGAPADQGLVDHLATIWLRSEGDLGQVYAGLLEHDASRAAPVGKIKPPFDFVVSALRALGVGSSDLTAEPRMLRQVVDNPVRLMGQRLFQPRGPDGWSEDPEAWLTPQGLAVRIRWAMRFPGRLRDTLPDPRDFLEDTLGPVADGGLSWAVAASETRAQGVGLVLSSPAFIRR